MSQTRRDFIKYGLSAGAVGALGGCAQLDRLVLGDSRDMRQQVLILGAGAAGLTAALELRKRNIPFRIFEGSARWGGRVMTLTDFNLASQSVEMGAEWIHSDHHLVLNLARELKVNVIEVKELMSSPSFYFGGKFLSEKDIWRGLRDFRRQATTIFPRGSDEVIDRYTLKQVLKKLEAQAEPWIPLWVERAVGLESGVTTDSVSALPFFARWLWEAREPISRLQARRFKIEGGTSVLINALYSRISGIIPDQFIQMNHELIEVRERLGGLELRFDTPDGRTWVQAKNVICTLPLTILKDIKGIDDIQLSDSKLKVIRETGYGLTGKAAMSYSKRFWRQDSELFRWSGDFNSQWFWQGDLKVAGAVPVARGAIVSQWAGADGANAGPANLDQMRKDLQKIFPKYSEEMPEEGGQVMNWSRHRWSKGSVAYYGPHQAKDFPEFLREPERDGSLLFAGEHVSRDNMGTLQGAMETGTAAAEFMSQLIKIS